MSDNTKILQEEFDLIKKDLIEAHERKGMKASGKFAEELEVRVQPNLASLFGAPHSQQLETGRKAGKFPPIDDIEKWIFDKGLDARIEGNITVRSLAFLIARKIAREGWKREEFGGVDLISEVITEKRIQSIIDKVGEKAALDFTTEIIGLFDELKVA